MVSLLLTLMLVMFGKAEETCSLKVKVIGFSQNQGDFYVSLFRGPEGFLKRDSVFQRKKQTITKTEETIEFSEIPCDKYGAFSFQDLNGSGELERSFIGFPKEPYGFSNNIAPKFKPPGFDDCAIDVKTTSEIEIKLLKP